MQQSRYRKRTLRRLVPALALLLAACALRPAPPPRLDPPLDPQQAHPLSLRRHAVSLAVDVGAAGAALPAAEQGRLAAFYAGFAAVGRGPLRIAAGGPPGSEEPALAPARLIRDHAVAHGVPPDRIRLYFEPAETGAQGLAVLSYDRLSVVLPECRRQGTDVSAFARSNTAHPDFGCATQRYVGRMVANPARLFHAAPVSYFDTPRTDAVIEHYRAGEPTLRRVERRELTVETGTTK